jgi:hypothetical protein
VLAIDDLAVAERIHEPPASSGSARTSGHEQAGSRLISARCRRRTLNTPKYPERRHMSNSSDTQHVELQAPPADLKALGDRLVGTWKISGENEGETSWEWMEGGFFLIQRGWSRREERSRSTSRSSATTGRPAPSPPMRSAVVCTPTTATRSPTCASWRGDTMTIWMDEKGSPAVYTGTFSADGNTIEGEWEWPGGGYKETMTRADA